jgi:hypothetical protein
MSLLGLPQSFQPSGDELQSNVPLCINVIDGLRVGDSAPHVRASPLHLYSAKNVVLMKILIKR